MSSNPSTVLFNDDRQQGQSAGGLLSLICSIPIAIVLVFMTFGCLDLGKFKFNQTESQSKKTNDLCCTKGLLRWIPQRVYSNPAVTLHFISTILGLVETVTNAARQHLHWEDNPDQLNSCKALSRTFVLTYGLSKGCTYMFLGIRARLVFRSQEGWTRKMVNIVTFVFPCIFIALGVDSSFWTTGSNEDGQRCVALVTLNWVGKALPGVDFFLSFLFLLLFLIPLRSLAVDNEKALKRYASPNATLNPNSLKPAEDELTVLMRETIRTAVAQIAFSGIALGFIAWASVTGGPFGLFSASFLSVDLVANCLVQFYSTRRVWKCSNKTSADLVKTIGNSTEKKTPLAEDERKALTIIDEPSKTSTRRSIEKTTETGKLDEPFMPSNIEISLS
jgi:hypothetical protein